MSTPYLIDIRFARMQGGAFLPPSGDYGSFALRDSTLTDLTDYTYVWYPTGNCYFERNQFIRTFGIDILHDGPSVFVRNNLFFQTKARFAGYAAVQNRNARVGRTVVEFNTFQDLKTYAVALPSGYHWNFGEGFDRDYQAGQQMLFNTAIALLLVYVVMCAMFESLIFPAAILMTFVFSIFGVFWLFWLTGTTFSIMAAIGVLILMGVVVNNGIVMIVHINTLRHEGHLRVRHQGDVELLLGKTIACLRIFRTQGIASKASVRGACR